MDATRYFVNNGINRLKNIFILKEVSRISLTNDEIKGVMRLSQSLENRGIY